MEDAHKEESNAKANQDRIVVFPACRRVLRSIANPPPSTANRRSIFATVVSFLFKKITPTP
jgi:hypothetical protein